jgi:hypothetical protein
LVAQTCKRLQSSFWQRKPNFFRFFVLIINGIEENEENH